MLINIRSVSNKLDDLLLFLDYHNFPKIVIIVEHWLKPDETIYIPNYVLVSKFSRTLHSHGGTLILVYEEFLNDCCEFVQIDRYQHLLEEMMCEFSIVFCSRLNLYVLGFYRSPGANVQHFLKKLDIICCQVYLVML